MKIQVLLTIDVPDSEIRHLKASRSLAYTSQVRQFIRERAAEAVATSDWMRDIEAGVALTVRGAR